MAENEVKVYLHQDYSIGEIMEVYEVDEAEAERIKDATYEVGLIVNKATGEVVRLA